MNSDKFDSLLFALHNLQNANFHLIAVPDDKINRKEEKEMEQTFRLKEQSFTFDKKGMILKGIISNDGQRVFVRAWNMYLDNKNTMSDDEAEGCLAKGINNVWTYWMSELEPLTPKVHLSKLEYELLKYYCEHGYQYIARDKDRRLYIYKFKPCKLDDEEWFTQEDDYIEVKFENTFPFINWENELPYYIPCMLYNCEVDENA